MMHDGSKIALAIDAATGQPDVPDHPDLQRLLAYWSDRRRGRFFPCRQDIDPVDLAFMLNRIALTEIHDVDPRDRIDAGTEVGPFYRFRIVGTWWRDLIGMELTGFWADELPTPRMTEITVDFYRAMTALRQPLFAKRDAWVEEKRYDYQIMILPLSEDGVRISMIMTGIGPRET